MALPTKMSPETIMSRLFYFRDAAHKFHLATRSHPQHEALDTLYKGIQDLQDQILEQSLGYTGTTMSYDPKDAMLICDQISKFSVDLKNWGENKGYMNVENLAQELSGLSAQVKYFLLQGIYKQEIK